jgi:hypothetical protein
MHCIVVIGIVFGFVRKSAALLELNVSAKPGAEMALCQGLRCTQKEAQIFAHSGGFQRTDRKGTQPAYLHEKASQTLLYRGSVSV